MEPTAILDKQCLYWASTKQFPTCTDSVEKIAGSNLSKVK